ncbi:MAG: phosphoesterase [Planctomycetaceae bacterium]|jgi:predicted NUDIX family phosphoesterase|nr:phosphoesterase [Planctomycetaceae bacterium]
MEENVLVVPTKLFHSLGLFQGFCADVEKYRDVLLAPQNVQFLPRSIAEKDPAFKQLIPYMLFCWLNPAGQYELFQYVRGKGAGEQRLRSKKSVGVGGHINSVDGGEISVYTAGMLRELNEEVVLSTDFTEQCAGLLNDDSTEVGQVHLGIVHRFDVKEPNVKSNEPDLIESGFVPVDEMLKDLTGFESWSSICINALFRR